MAGGRVRPHAPGRVTSIAAHAPAADTLSAALNGIDVAYYLMHSMAAGPDSPRLDRVVSQLPAMVTRRRVRSRSQPIALDDVLEYLARLPR